MFWRNKEIYQPPSEASLSRISAEQLEANTRLTTQMKNSPPLGKLDSAAWFVPYFDHALKGGLRTVFMIAQRFSECWNTKNHLIIDNFFDRKENSNIEEQLKEYFPKLNFELIYLPSTKGVQDLPAADAGFCTLWVTAYTLARYNQCRAKFYLLQDYEPNFYVSGSISAVIEHSYRLGFYFIANTPGVGSYFRKYSDWGMEFLPGVDKKTYYPKTSPVKRNGPYQIVFYGRPGNERNCFTLCIEALRLVKETMGEQVKIISVGASYSRTFYRLKGVVENYGLLSSLEEVADLYRESDLAISLMTTPHPSYQPLEYMASGCPCLSNMNESNNWLYVNGENIVLSEPLVNIMAKNIIDTLHSHELRQRLRDGGLATVQKLNWEKTLDVIADYVAKPKRITR